MIGKAGVTRTRAEPLVQLPVLQKGIQTAAGTVRYGTSTCTVRTRPKKRHDSCTTHAHTSMLVRIEFHVIQASAVCWSLLLLYVRVAS